MDELRRKFAALRAAISPEDLEYRSGIASANLIRWLENRLNPDSVIGLYRTTEPNRSGEANPFTVTTSPTLALQHFAFPRITDRFHRELDFCIPAHSADWTIGQYGIPEPLPDLPAVDPSSIDCIIVPAVVFGLRGERIGRGGGFYDRYLARATQALRIGFGFDFQVVGEALPQAHWDAPMDVIITDLRTIETSGRQS